VIETNSTCSYRGGGGKSKDHTRMSVNEDKQGEMWEEHDEGERRGMGRQLATCATETQKKKKWQLRSVGKKNGGRLRGEGEQEKGRLN